ncbi:sugar ABC transporter substrate-binding protein [Scatolibacter rhodanostii]|uniref:sugar ABC transporter substrate-binding protein n=1 Tax=Scatolibacter rhodanostii TaxID=2014781 RepID=UPI000C069C8B|nr:sugar ABC transporter substrate-binding protein [Scatolibacter rhodanostii]
MKKRKVVSLLLAFMLLFSFAMGGCSDDEKVSTESDASKAVNSSSTGAAAENTSTDSKELLTIEMYNVAANYHGVQSGWFGKILKDKFNIEMNIIAPQVAGDGDALYQTRTASGYLGDIVLLDNADLQDCITAGLVQEITDDVKNSTYLKELMEQYDVYNGQFEGVEAGKIFGLPCGINDTSPTTYSEPFVYISPWLPWDYYSEIGNPEMKDLEDLLDVLEQIQTAHPTNELGDPNYALSLWNDWDKGGTQITIETATQLTKMYGQEVRGAILLSNKGEMTEVTDDSGAYYKMLKFFFDANQRGLLDPDSGTQDWETACDKMKNKQVLLHWYNWQRGFWNTTDRANEGNAYIYAPVADMDFYQPSDNYYGDGRAFAVGANLDEEKRARVIEFLDWFASPEANTLHHDGLEGFNYTVNEDGTFTQTEDGMYALMENREVPAEFGGGGYNDGLNKINQSLYGNCTINPLTGEPYMVELWSSYIEANQTKMSTEWSALYNAEDPVDLMTKSGQLDIVPSVNLILPSDTTDIGLIRSQCANIICDTSWRMIFASSEEEFKQMWDEMKTQLDGLGWKQLVEFDKTSYQKVVDARAEAVSSAE